QFGPEGPGLPLRNPMRSQSTACSFRLTVVGCALAILFLLISRAMFRRLDHDEHQFIASAALLSRRGLLPYRDYPHFPMPYLVFIYALLFKLTDHLLLAARLFSAMCGFVTVTLVGWVTWRLSETREYSVRRLNLGAIVFILIANPLFLFTS